MFREGQDLRYLPVLFGDLRTAGIGIAQITGETKASVSPFQFQDGAMVEFQDRVLKCIDCGTDFVFTAGEQQFYHEKDFKNEPKRCRNCKTKRQSGPSDRGGPPGRVETSAVCSQCGRETTVPFRPTQGRPVFCRQCFQGRKAMGAAAG